MNRIEVRDFMWELRMKLDVLQAQINLGSDRETVWATTSKISTLLENIDATYAPRVEDAK